jgi:hypothetical protein
MAVEEGLRVALMVRVQNLIEFDPFEAASLATSAWSVVQRHVADDAIFETILTAFGVNGAEAFGAPSLRAAVAGLANALASPRLTPTQRARMRCIHLASPLGLSRNIEILTRLCLEPLRTLFTLRGGSLRLLARWREETQDTHARALLHACAVEDNGEAIGHALTVLGADPNAPATLSQGLRMWTPLELATAKDNFRAVRALINAGADCDRYDGGCSWPIRVAVKKGFLCTFDLLIAESNVQLVGWLGRTILWEAVHATDHTHQAYSMQRRVLEKMNRDIADPLERVYLIDAADDDGVAPIDMIVDRGTRTALVRAYRAAMVELVTRGSPDFPPRRMPQRDARTKMVWCDGVATRQLVPCMLCNRLHPHETCVDLLPLSTSGLKTASERAGMDDAYAADPVRWGLTR